MSDPAGFNNLIAFISNAIQIVIEGMSSTEVISALNHDSIRPSVVSFCSENESSLLLRKKTEQEIENLGAVPALVVSKTVEFVNHECAGVIFFKTQPGQLDLNHSLAAQLQIIYLDEEYSEEDKKEDGVVEEKSSTGINPVTIFQSYLSNALTPLLSSFITVDKKDDTDSSMLLKKINELEVALNQYQQNMEIPEIHLQYHALIKNAAQLCYEKKTLLTLKEVGLEEAIQDNTFINKLQEGVNRWVKEIQKVTKLKREVIGGSTLQEVNFWNSMERALLDIQEKQQSYEVQLTLNCLKAARRTLAVMTFENDTGLITTQNKVKDIMELMRNFPIDAILAAPTLEDLDSAIVNVFIHLKKFRNISSYPIASAGELVNSISRDITDRLYKLLPSKNIMSIPITDFDHLSLQMKKIINNIESGIISTRDEILRDYQKRTNQSGVVKYNFTYPLLNNRFIEIYQFRKNHEQFRSILIKVMDGGADSIQIQQLDSAYRPFLGINALDTSSDGTSMWKLLQQEYDQQIDEVEKQIIINLKEKLSNTKTSDEMFRVFKRFNALFVRPRIQGAIQQFQSQLIKQVREDMEQLQHKFKDPYKNSEAALMSKVHDIPPVSGNVIWNRQIEAQLYKYRQRLATILGDSWTTHPEGRLLQEQSENFIRRLSTKSMVEKWFSQMESIQFNFNVPLFTIQEQGLSGLVLTVNFDPAAITLFKEIRNLKWLGFRLPITTRMIADNARTLYPLAMSLQDSLNTYQMTIKQLIDDTPLLVSQNHSQIHEFFNELLNKNITWSTPNVESRVQKFASLTDSFNDKVNEVINNVKLIKDLTKELKTCPFEKGAFANKIDDLQNIITKMDLLACSNLTIYCSKLDKEIESILLERLNKAIKTWIDVFTIICSPDANEQFAQKKEDEFGEPFLVSQMKAFEGYHSIEMKGTQLTVEPPVSDTRTTWLNHLMSTIDIIINLPRLRGIVSMNEIENLPRNKRTYCDLISQVNPEFFNTAILNIENLVNQVQSYVQTWLKFQVLWDVNPSEIADKLEDNFDTWQEVLVEVTLARKNFDSPETEKLIGPVVIDFQQVQAKMQLRYDALHKELLSRFSHILKDSMNTYINDLTTTRALLESRTFDAPVSEAVELVFYTNEIQKKIPIWESQLTTYQKVNSLLHKQRFQFPNNWLSISQVEGEWSALSQINSRKYEALQHAFPELKLKINEEDHNIQLKLSTLISDWNEQKPLDGSIPCMTAVSLLSNFDTRINTLSESWTKCNKGKEALGLDVELENPLESIHVELKGLQEMWTLIAPYWDIINRLMESTWASVIPKQIKTQLDNISQQMEDCPNRIMQYEAFIYLKDFVTRYARSYKFLLAIKESPLKDRHWNDIFKIINYKNTINNLTLGDFWKYDLKKIEKPINEVLAVAQGEMALENFLNDIKTTWNNWILELAVYHNKTKLIKGWDFFQKMDEHISSLQGMKQSRFYKIFQDEAETWDNKLNQMHVIFDMWIDVQRRWIYLEGIFMGSADIKQQLPNEYTRFKTIDADFIGLMKKVAQNPNIIEVYNIKDLNRILERLGDLLTKVEKALGEYLDKQRLAFSRFYFVGDEDLLEIIGNSANPAKVQRHLNKMFMGINHLILETRENKLPLIKGMTSKEGETVMFINPVDIEEDPKVVSWLSKVEQSMQNTVASLLDNAINEINEMTTFRTETYLRWARKYPAQIIILCTQILWSNMIEKAYTSNNPTIETQHVLDYIDLVLNTLADQVMKPLPIDERKKYEQLINEHVYQRNSTVTLIREKVFNVNDFKWQYHLRYYYNSNEAVLLRKLQLKVADACFYYGFEYLGVCERLVQTPLTDKCYLTLTQALNMGMGGNPFGPAGTGKTESVKMLAAQLGRFCLVFNCDENFDFQAMGRIFRGLCQVGAWGCFDEFNRLPENILSAVSQQILTIQTGLMEKSKEIVLIDKTITLHPNVGIFVTMNPGYAGRSNLPDNLKQLFRAIAMIKPDWEQIAQVMLYSQGFRTSSTLAGKVVLLFNLCTDQLSSQSHYDFGLRALKSVLVAAGNMKRERMKKKEEENKGKNLPPLTDEQQENEEKDVLISAISDNTVPKLVAEDIPLLKSLVAGVFPGYNIRDIDSIALKNQIKEECKKNLLEPTNSFVEKVLQLYQVQDIRHGIMNVGPTGSGKTSAIRILAAAMDKLDGIKTEIYVIDPKALRKEELFGTLDNTTLEWTDGIFTYIIRQILNNNRGESNKRHWVVFDGDVDPEWAENLNSVLDDNKLLTLPSGDRLALTPNIRIMFEVETLKYATPASVSRCGVIWYSEDCVKEEDIFHNCLNKIRNIPLIEDAPRDVLLILQNKCVDILSPFFEPDGLVSRALAWSLSKAHVMDTPRMQLINCLICLLQQTIKGIWEYNENNEDFPLSDALMNEYLPKKLIEAIIWGFTGSSNFKIRTELCDLLRVITTIKLPPEGTYAIDYCVDMSDGEWHPWKEQVPILDIEPQKILDASLIIPTVDTLRHVSIAHACLSAHLPVIFCGPPGSGKSMTLTDTLKAMPNLELVSVNFSSSTTPELLLKIFDQYCEYKKTPNGLILRPLNPDKWIVIFCDECNLPEEDKYGTQRVITFLRELLEHGCFWRPKDHQLVTIERIQFVGACNPPTDAGRVPLSHRFLVHAPVMLVDYPAPFSLEQIYGTFCRGLLKIIPSLRSYADKLTAAMVRFYTINQTHFTADQHPHYIYSPRELSRWIRALYGFISARASMTPEELVRIYAHEALRLFHDRLVTEEERTWCEHQLDMICQDCFTGVDMKCIERPILYTHWLSSLYDSCDRDSLRTYLQKRLKTFCEDELEVELVLFDDVLEHVLRIDRVLRQPIGHLLMVGESGAGKTVLSKFVAWMNGMSIFQIKISKKYTIDNFDDDLRMVMKKAGVDGEQICFIFDESNILSSAFLERMNALLASGEVPGLFEDDEMSQLLNQMRDSMSKEGINAETSDELFKIFTRRVQMNLHVVFTMNPASGDFKGRAATSPALFNRCVVDWFGTWNRDALYQVAQYFTSSLQVDDSNYHPTTLTRNLIGEALGQELEMDGNVTLHDSIASCIYHIHQGIRKHDQIMSKGIGTHTFPSPRDYLDFIRHYLELTRIKREELEEQQKHLDNGLDKLNSTEAEVLKLKDELSVKKVELTESIAKANKKLDEIIQSQKVAEVEQEKATKLSEELNEQKGQVEQRQTYISDKLAHVEPMVQEAKQAVQGINAKDIKWLISLTSPPDILRLCLEAVCILLGQNVKNWSDIQKVLRSAGFVKSVVELDAKRINPKASDAIKSKYLPNPDFTYEKINRGSVACGPLYKWIVSIIEYAEIIQQIKPWNDELIQLKNKLVVLEDDHQKCMNKLDELDKMLTQFKNEYAELTRNVDHLKNEIDSVTVKVDRATKLLESLKSEQSRWKISSENFKTQIQSICGDCLLSGAFLTYSGFWEHHSRQRMIDQWKGLLKDLEIPIDPSFELQNYLSDTKQRQEWQVNHLPVDDYCIENAIILKHFMRYPLIIDPSGQGTDFIMTHYSNPKITKTSFLEPNFMKQLEQALRFGTQLLIQDVENADPVMNPLLNKEFRKAGGRTLIRLGEQEIDFSPTFRLFMTTRDNSYQFPPDLCSRVTFVNFTVTPSSLQEQCLSLVLQREAPEVFEQRAEQIKLQGEFVARLRELEDKLLDALNNLKGNILENDVVMNTLENLKKESGEIAEKMKQADSIMEALKSTSDIYNPLAKICSRIYFAMEELENINILYRYSLSFYMDVVYNVLNHETADITSAKKRMEKLMKDLFIESYARVARGLKHIDARVFALRLAQLYLENEGDEPDFDEFSLLIHGVTTTVNDKSILLVKQIFGDQLNEEQSLLLASHLSLKNTQTLQNHMMEHNDWWINTFLTSNDGKVFNDIPDKIGEMNWSVNKTYWRYMLLIKELRPECVISVIEDFVCRIFGDNFLEGEVLKLKDLLLTETKAESPLLLCSMPGYDPSAQIDTLAKELKKHLNSVSMGNQESFDEANKQITQCATQGGFVLLRNVHLCPEWLSGLEKKIYNLKLNPNFRLFLTSEIHPKLPPALIRLSYTLMFETPSGVRASLTRSLRNIPEERMCAAPIERSKLYFLLAWLHALIEERLRYVPAGWTKAYEFSETDQRCSMNVIDYWVNHEAKGASHVDPDKLSWTAIRTLLVEALYGGRIDNTFDNKLLDSLLRQTFVPEAFSPHFALVKTFNDKGIPEVLLEAPEGNTKEQFLSWANTLPSRNSPLWLGLPATAEERLLSTQGSYAINELLKVQGSALENNEDQENNSSRDKLMNTVEMYLKETDIKLEGLVRDAQLLNNPLFRFLDREIKIGIELLTMIRSELTAVLGSLNGSSKATQQTRSLIVELSADRIPKFWCNKYFCPPGQICSQWIKDFVLRIKQLSVLSKTPFDQIGSKGVWLGGFFQPEAFITASRQYVSQNHGWALGQLNMRVIPGGVSTEKKDREFIFHNLFLEGAEWQDEKLVPSDEIRTAMPSVLIRWEHDDEFDRSLDINRVDIPLYLSEHRSVLLCIMRMDRLITVPTELWSQRGTTLLAWRQTL
ncbi:hypothetical protein WA158_004348 [Blastocystis sp. Blastoise]